MPKLQDLIDKGIVRNNADGARECDLIGMFEPELDYLLLHKQSPILQIDQDEDGDICIITAEGMERIGEYPVRDPRADLDVEIYRRVML